MTIPEISTKPVTVAATCRNYDCRQVMGRVHRAGEDRRWLLCC
jgi:hypothetical protein